jgi:hypothetical protein
MTNSTVSGGTLRAIRMRLRLAGRRVTGGRVGVHRFRPENETDENFPSMLVQRGTEVLTHYVAHMGADPALVGLAMGVSPPAVRLLSADELRHYRVID